MNDARLHLVCGLPGAGKTTRARQIVEDAKAVHLSPDEWIVGLGISLVDYEFRFKLQDCMIVHAGNILRCGASTVVEFVNPPGFAPPLHRHLEEDELFYVLPSTAQFRCDGETLWAGPGDFVVLPARLPHTFLVGPDEPPRTLQITTPSGFEQFAADVGEPAQARRLPDPGPIDPAALGHAAARHATELLGPPPLL